MPDKFSTFLEVGKRKVFAGAVDWAGWSRAGKDETSALETLLEYGPRYARVLKKTGLNFSPPADVSVFEVTERLQGNSTTDFGAPGIPLAGDELLVSRSDLQRFRDLLEAYWLAFDEALESAAGVTLRKGPRGGGRDLNRIIKHILESEAGYLGALGWKIAPLDPDRLGEERFRVRKEVLLGLESAAAGELPRKGPRGGKRWAPRYCFRRVAWHVLDHTWEIEDRIE